LKNTEKSSGSSFLTLTGCPFSAWSCSMLAALSLFPPHEMAKNAERKSAAVNAALGYAVLHNTKTSKNI
jgi:hypothetical protein